MQKIIFHIDVNSAFLSWSAVKMLREGSMDDIREMDAVIGGSRENRHGVVLAKSISAKKYGIRTGEPIAGAVKKCPGLVIIPPEHSYYYEQSRLFINILKEYTPDIEQVSVDECYLDFSGIRGGFESPEAAADIMRNRIKDELGFTVNVGISDCKILAKMASDFEKPDKTHTLYRSEIKEKMWPLPVGSLFMVGRSCSGVLRKLGIKTIGDLACTNPDILELHLKSHGRIIWEYANGIDESGVSTEDADAKGIGNSVTLPKDVTELAEAKKVLLALSDKVALRLRKSGQKAGLLCVEIKYSDFTKVSHQMVLEKHVSSCEGIYEAAVELYSKLWNRNPVRLIGIRSGKLKDMDEPEQLSLFDYMEGSMSVNEDKRKKADEAMDRINAKYGNKLITKAGLMGMGTKGGKGDGMEKGQ